MKLENNLEEVFEINGEVRKKTKTDLEIVLESNIYKSYIIYQNKRFPLSVGLVLGGDIHGFRVTVNIPSKESSTIYPTHASIYGIELYDHDVKVYEQDKSIPWTFTKIGELIGEADYNKLLRSEQKSYCERHHLTQEELEKEMNCKERKLH